MPLNAELDADQNLRHITPEENRAFRYAGLTMLALIAGLALLLAPENSLWRAPDGSLTSQAPVMQAIVPLLFLFFAIPASCSALQ